MVDRSDSFLREVDEEVRRERLRQIWQKYGLYLSLAVAALFAGVIGYQWSQSRLIARQEAVGLRFEAASRLAAEQKADEALKAFADIAGDAPAGYQSLAQLRVAATHVKAGRVADALQAYEALAKSGDADDLLRDFAAIQAAVLRLDQADWTEMKNRLTPLIDDKRPWHGAAREVLGLAALKAGQHDEAMKLFEQILGDKTSTSGLRRRAQDMLAILTDAAAAKAAPAQPSTAPAGEGTTGPPATTK